MHNLGFYFLLAICNDTRRVVFESSRLNSHREYIVRCSWYFAWRRALLYGGLQDSKAPRSTRMVNLWYSIICFFRSFSFLSLFLELLALPYGRPSTTYVHVLCRGDHWSAKACSRRRRRKKRVKRQKYEGGRRGNQMFD